MQTKKIIGIALVAAMLSSVVAVSVSARDTIPDEELPFVVADHTYGVIGNFTTNGPDDSGWGADFVALTGKDGVYTAVIEGIPAGDYSGKVRADGAWTDSWGDANDDGICYNDQDNVSVTVAEGQVVYVKFDTTVFDEDLGKDDPNNYLYWPVSFTAMAPEDVPTEESQTSQEGKTPLAYSTFGIVGAIFGENDPNNWGGPQDAPSDIEMTDSDGDGVFEGSFTGKGDVEFKVRADKKWDASWGKYSEDDGATKNGDGHNIALSLGDAEVTVQVKIDTNGEDDTVWPVSYKVGDGEWVYTGETEEESQTSTESQASTESQTSTESQASQDSTTSTVESETSVPAYKTVRDDYIYFDNSKTKWSKVCVYFFGTDPTGATEGFLPITDMIGRDITLPLAENGFPTWPGNEMKKIGDTDVWQYTVPKGATKIIFNNGWSDEAVDKYYDDNIGNDADKKKAAKKKELSRDGYEVALQTADIEFNSDADKGKVYSVEPAADGSDITWGAGKKYLKGVFAATSTKVDTYNGEFVSEEFGQEDTKASTPESKDSTTSTPESKPAGDGKGTADGKSIPATSDTAMAVAFVGVAVAALGAAVLASKKKRDEE